ncbi:hypothetical protein MSSIT_3661 [Methanosarcina siciliae T4/M]|uniref:Uncharacterized protein n=1 Tax=Methanosarcina siciliae T4/M TaxID=1434120 RepID=A0A0E3P8S9_9EURY|nr:hypothetical protein MSSIT_3661 [Methanosarcina siciliae T4/M]
MPNYCANSLPYTSIRAGILPRSCLGLAVGGAYLSYALGFTFFFFKSLKWQKGLKRVLFPASGRQSSRKWQTGVHNRFRVFRPLIPFRKGILKWQICAFPEKSIAGLTSFWVRMTTMPLEREWHCHQRDIF